MRILRGILACCVLVVGLGTVAIPGAAAVPGTAAVPVTAPSTVRVGSVTLHRCQLGIDRGLTWCGSVRVPLDYTDPDAAAITIAFGWHPAPSMAGDPSSTDTIVAQEGGPGYPSTGTAPDFADMLGGLLQHRNLLVVDARGTGRSTPLDCEPLQSLNPISANATFERAVAGCGAQLNHTFHSTHGGYVHASDLFTTANSARDLAAVLRALHQSKVDLYGDSYGTYFAQSFLSRYPKMLRSVVLDSAYEARDLDPWYVTTVRTARRAFAAVCVQAAACRAATGSQANEAWARITTLTHLLRLHPIVGTAPGVDAKPVPERIDVTALVNIVNDAGYDPDPYRQLDAAVRAYLDHRDATPLIRLYAQDIGYDYSDYQARAPYYSDGLYMAVACTDYPQLFDMRSGRAARTAELAHAVKSLPTATFAPFTTREWLSVLPYTETFTGCLSWPKPAHPADPAVPTRASMDATHVPVLILNGALDSLTPAAGGAHIQRQIGSAARQIVVPGMVHLVGLDDRYGCGASLVQQFFASHGRGRVDQTCVARVPEIHAVGTFPRTVSSALPASGPAPSSLRRQAAVAIAAVGDAATRYNYVDGNRDLGLRGGRVTYRPGDGMVTATLHAVRWTDDATISGMARSDVLGLMVTAHVTLKPDHGPANTFVIAWNTSGRGTKALVRTGQWVLSAPAP